LATPPQLCRTRWCPHYNAMPGPSNRLVVCCAQYPHLILDAVNLAWIQGVRIAAGRITWLPTYTLRGSTDM